MKTCNLQFRWNFQLLTRCSAFRNLPCSTTNLLMVDTGRNSVALNTSGVTRTVALDILNVFLQDGAHCRSSWRNYVYSKIFFAMSHFLVVEDHEFSQSTSHLLSVSLTLKYVRILILIRLFFFLHHSSPWWSSM